MAAVVLIYNHMSTSSCGDKKENDLSFMEWKEDEEIDGTWSQSRFEDESEKDESEMRKRKMRATVRKRKMRARVRKRKMGKGKYITMYITLTPCK